MWVVLIIALLSSTVEILHASKTQLGTDGRSHTSEQIMNNIPAVRAMSVKTANDPTVTSFTNTEELQYPGIRGSKDISSKLNQAKEILKSSAVVFARISFA
jgi:hypothetical protein